MSFGSTIRQLRRKQSMTQEKLAELLMISPQAVSRWETGAAMPDISLIAPLCNIFNITADGLLEIDIRNRQAEIDGYAAEYGSYASTIQKTEALRKHTIEKLREGLRLYPDATVLKRQLAAVLRLNAEAPADTEEKKEMCRLYGELIAETDDINEKYRYIAQYCTYARFTGNTAEGKAYAQLLPETEYSRQRFLALCCEDRTERRERLNDYLRSSWGELRDAMLLLITEGENSSAEISRIRKKQEQINGILFDNDDLVKYEDFDEYKVAEAFYKAGDYSGAVDYLEICLTKWTEKPTAEVISSLRKKESGITSDEGEIKAEAEAFIKAVNTHFPELLTDERAVRLIDRAKRITAR